MPRPNFTKKKIEEFLDANPQFALASFTDIISAMREKEEDPVIIETEKNHTLPDNPDSVNTVNLLVNEREVNLVFRSGFDLGFNDVATYKQIYEVAQQSGLTFCTGEMVEELYYQYRNKSLGKHLFVAMDPETPYYIPYDVFWLGGDHVHSCSYPDKLFHPVYRFIFTSKKTVR